MPAGSEPNVSQPPTRAERFHVPPTMFARITERQPTDVHRPIRSPLFIRAASSIQSARISSERTEMNGRMEEGEGGPSQRRTPMPLVSNSVIPPPTATSSTDGVPWHRSPPFMLPVHITRPSSPAAVLHGIRCRRNSCPSDGNSQADCRSGSAGAADLPGVVIDRWSCRRPPASGGLTVEQRRVVPSGRIAQRPPPRLKRNCTIPDSTLQQQRSAGDTRSRRLFERSGSRPTSRHQFTGRSRP